MGSRRARAIRQDVSFLISILLVLAVIATVVTSLGGDESEFLGMDDDLHALTGWVLVVLAVAHVLLHLGQLTRYARRRTRSLLGIGAVSTMGRDDDPEEER